MCSMKKVFSKNSWKSQENTFARAWTWACNFIKNPENFAKFLRTLIYIEHLHATASVNCEWDADTTNIKLLT